MYPRTKRGKSRNGRRVAPLEFRESYKPSRLKLPPSLSLIHFSALPPSYSRPVYCTCCFRPSFATAASASFRFHFPVSGMLDMDAQVGAANLKGGQRLCAESLKLNAGANKAVMVNSKVCDCLDCSDKLDCLEPVTPNPNQESGEGVFYSKSPLSMVSPLLPDPNCFEFPTSDNLVAAPDVSACTPQKEVFDPFAPVLDEIVFAPVGKKPMKESWSIVVQRLNFEDFSDQALGERNEDNGNDLETLSEEMLLESIYGTFLAAIVLKETEIFLAENHPCCSTGSETPSSPPRLTGITETCPAAPIKAVTCKSRNIDPKLCRKLEFSLGAPAE
ncbi:hypothetical protein Ancab_014125 [Ancistrocladus abbreviatus]